MNKLFKALSLIPSFFLLTGFIPAPHLNAASSFDGRFYDKTTQMDFTDSTTEEINTYYGDIGSLKGSDLMNYLYDKIHIKTSEIKTYYPTYTDGVTDWYKITDRNWSLSREITPATYKFEADTGNNYYETMLYFTDCTSEAKQINCDVNSFTTIKGSNAAVDWTNKTRPSWTDASGYSNYVQVDKEHVWVKSHGFSPSGNPVQGAGTDLHHLIAADHTTNNIHNDKYYGKVADHSASSTKTIYCRYADGTSDVSGWVGDTDEGETVFEPTDQWKGDVARALFYMATNYCKETTQSGAANTEAEPYLVLTKGNEGSDDTDNYHGVFHNMEDFLEWNELDPVDSYESHRNNLIYKNVQNNRNPYVDHPEWVARVFDENYQSDDEGETSSSQSVSSNTSESQPTVSSSQPTPSSSAISSSSDSAEDIGDILLTKYLPFILIAVAIVFVLVIIITIIMIKTGHKKQVVKAGQRIVKVTIKPKKGSSSSSGKTKLKRKNKK